MSIKAAIEDLKQQKEVHVRYVSELDAGIKILSRLNGEVKLPRGTAVASGGKKFTISKANRAKKHYRNCNHCSSRYLAYKSNSFFCGKHCADNARHKRIAAGGPSAFYRKGRGPKDAD